LISAIVLAAGKSERMGRPKALLPIQGRTFLENILAAISRTSIEDAIVVLGHHRDQIERNVSLPSVVFNADYEQGMITSFQAGIRKLSWDTTGAFLFLVDHPLVEPTTIESMIMNLAPNRIVLPTFERRRGHPVLFSSEVLEEILALAPSEGANIVVRKNPDRIIEVPVNAPGILVDIDTPEQFERLRKDYP
jgi:molybdenum cofactor cytidylyltransferase